MTHTEYEYTTELVEETRLCEKTPHVTVLLRERTITRERQDDGTTVTTETPWRTVQSMEYQRKDDNQPARPEPEPQTESRGSVTTTAQQAGYTPTRLGFQRPGASR